MMRLVSMKLKLPVASRRLPVVHWQLTTGYWQLGKGVTDGTRTRDVQDHNLALYQLSYGHHQGLRRN